MTLPFTVEVSPGWAVDPLGREIVLTKPVRLEGSQTGAAEPELTAKWAQELAGPVPALDGSDDAQYDFVEERPMIDPVLNRRALLRPASGSSRA